MSRKSVLRHAAILKRFERDARRAVLADLPQLRSQRERTAAGMRFAPHWLRLAVLQRDGHRCRYCGASVTVDTANIDHVIPYPEGLTTMANLVAACQPCNHAKGRRRVEPRAMRAGR